MFRNILVPLDGSLRAERTLSVAARIARGRNATVTLVRVVYPQPEVGSYMIPTVLPNDALAEREEQEAHDYLNAIVASEILHGVAVKTAVGIGAPSQVILDTIRETRADGVVIGSHGRTGLSRWALGSVAQAIVRHSGAPVLLLRQQGPALGDDEAHARPLRILVPLDGSELAEAALGPAQLLGEAVSAPDGYTLHLVRVIQYPNTVGADPARDKARADAQAYLTGLAERFGVAAPVTTSVALDEDPADALARMTRPGQQVVGAPDADGYDLIAMATHGRSGLARLAIGSITERVLSATVAPALIVRPDAMKTDSRRDSAIRQNDTPLGAHR